VTIQTDTAFDRRTFIKGGLGATVLAGGAITELLRATGALANPSLVSQLDRIANSSQGQALRSALGQYFVNDASAIITMADEALSHGGSNLDTFQISLIKAIPIALKYPDVLAAVLSGTPLTGTQKHELVQTKADLYHNAAIQKWRSEAAQLLDQPSVIAQDLQNIQSAGSNFPLPSLSSSFLGFDLTALADSVAVVNGGAGVFGQVTGLFGSDLVSFIQGNKPEVAMTIIPIPTVLSYVLPAGKPDSLFDALEDAFLGMVVAVGGFCILLLTLPADFAVAAAVLIIGAIVFLGGLLLVQHMFDESQFADCDHDGDPTDPSDTPGNEC
jgi:hypothetical protein